MRDINFLFGALRFGLEVAWKPIVYAGWFIGGIIAMFVIWWIWDIIQTKSIRRHINRKRIRLIDGRVK